jgi:nucleoside 2-deoxyribosyltransferase
LAGDQLPASGISGDAGPIRVFVAMSFRTEEEPALVDYWQAMLRAAKQARREFDLRRADEIEGDYEIMERVYKEIDSAQLVIADLMLSPSNVYLELGYGRGRGKPPFRARGAKCHLAYFDHAAMLVMALVRTGLASWIVGGRSCRAPVSPGFLTR